MSGLPPLPGHPGAVRLLADRLASTAARLSALASVLARLRDGATWDGPAGEAFGARLRELGPVLEAVSVRLGGAAPPLRSLADAMEEAQGVVARAVLDVDEAQHAYAVLEDRAAALVAGGAGADDPGMLLVRHLQLEQVEAEQVARARHRAAAERFQRGGPSLRRRAAHPVGRRPRRLGALPRARRCQHRRPRRGDPRARRDGAARAGAGRLRRGWGWPWLADATLLAAYGEGDAGALARSAALSGLGAAGGVLRAGATAGAERTAAGVVSTARLTGQQRLALGVVHEVRRRRDALRASFRVPPARGTPSAARRRPPVRGRGSAAVLLAVRAWGPGSRCRPCSIWPGRAARRAVTRSHARRPVARVDRAFLDDWRLATANGPQAQRMYTAGVTLETRRPPVRGRRRRPEQGGGGNVR